MPQIDLCFSGWIRGLNVDTVQTIQNGDIVTVDVSGEDPESVVSKLGSGEYTLELKESLGAGYKENIEFSDFDVSNS